MTDFDISQRNKLVNLFTRRELFSRLGMGAGAMALAALLSEQARADAVAARQPYTLHPKQPHMSVIKRIVAVEGDRVAIKGGRAIVNGMAVEEPYVDPGPGDGINANRAAVRRAGAR